MVAKYAEKRKELKEAGDYRALALLPRGLFSGKVEEPLRDHWSSERIYQKVRDIKN